MTFRSNRTCGEARGVLASRSGVVKRAAPPTFSNAQTETCEITAPRARRRDIAGRASCCVLRAARGPCGTCDGRCCSVICHASLPRVAVGWGGRAERNLRRNYLPERPQIRVLLFLCLDRVPTCQRSRASIGRAIPNEY